MHRVTKSAAGYAVDNLSNLNSLSNINILNNLKNLWEQLGSSTLYHLEVSRFNLLYV